MTLAATIDRLLGGDMPVRIETYDGSVAGDLDAETTVRITSPDAISRIVRTPNELGFARAYIEGEIVVEGPLDGVFGLHDRLAKPSRDALQALPALVKLVGPSNLKRLPLPPEETRPKGRLHSLRRDKEVVSAHYDVSNDFYALILGDSMTYSCAVFESPHDTLGQAQNAKHELSLRKLALRPGTRLLDIGCGWGAHLIHAARHFDVECVGVTISHEQAMLARKRIADEGLSDRIEIREQDYREIPDGPFDSVSSIGMFEHVGRVRTPEFVSIVHDLVKPGGRVLLHSITDPAGAPSRRGSTGFISRYIFPDGELQRIGEIIDAVQSGGLDVLDVEALNDHYGPTLDHWRSNLEANWDEAVTEVGERRCRIWELYLAGCAWFFHAGHLGIQQLTAARRPESGGSAFPSRPDWDPRNLDRLGG
jgi:cyclopropane-fatty-acyl-phospholipid synthase